jgi:hypothetical protein
MEIICEVRARGSTPGSVAKAYACRLQERHHRLVASVMSVVSVIFYCWYFDVILTRRHRLTTADTTDTPDFLRAHAFCQLFTVAQKLPENRCNRKPLTSLTPPTSLVPKTVGLTWLQVSWRIPLIVPRRPLT